MIRLEKANHGDVSQWKTHMLICGQKVLVKNVTASASVQVFPFEFVCSDTLTFTTFFYLESKLRQKNIRGDVSVEQITVITHKWKRKVHAELVASCINKIRKSMMEQPQCYIELDDSDTHVENDDRDCRSDVYYVHKCAAEEIIHVWLQYLNRTELLEETSELLKMVGDGPLEQAWRPMLFLDLPDPPHSNIHDGTLGGLLQMDPRAAQYKDIDTIRVSSIFSGHFEIPTNFHVDTHRQVDTYHCLNGNMTITAFFYIYHCLPEGVPFLDTIQNIVSHFPSHIEVGTDDLNYVTDIFCKVRLVEYNYIRLIDDSIFKTGDVFHISKNMVDNIISLWSEKQAYVELTEQNVYNWTSTVNRPNTKRTKQKHSATDCYGRNVPAPHSNTSSTFQGGGVGADDIRVPNAVHLSRHNDVKMTMGVDEGSHYATFCVLQLEHLTNISGIGSDRRKTGWHLKVDRAKLIDNLLSRSSSARNNRTLSFVNREQIFQAGKMLIHSNDDQSGQPYLCLKIYDAKKKRLLNENLGIGSLTPITEQTEPARINHDTLTWHTVEDTDVERVAMFVRPPSRSIGIWVCYYRVPFRTTERGSVTVALRLCNSCHTVSLLRGNIVANRPSSVVPTDIMTGKWAKKIVLFHRQYLQETFNAERDALFKDKAVRAVIDFEGDAFHDPSLRNLIQHVSQQSRGWRMAGRKVHSVSVDPGTYLKLDDGTVMFECLEKNDKQISWVTCCAGAFNGQTLCFQKATLRVRQVKYYPRLDIQDMKQKWYSLNNLWNLLTGQRAVWVGDKPVPNLWNRLKNSTLLLPFDNYGGNMGIQTTQTLQQAYKMRCMIARAMIEGPEEKGSFVMSSSTRQKFTLVSSLQRAGTTGIVSNKNWFVESLRGRARVNRALGAEFDNFGYSGQTPGSHFHRDTHAQEQRESFDGIPYYKTFPCTSDRAYEKDPELTHPFKYETENRDLELMVSSGTRLTQVSGFVMYPQRKITTKNAISEVKTDNGKKSRCETIPADVFNDPTQFDTCSPHGICYGPIGFHTHHGKIGGTKEDWDAIRDIWHNSKWESVIELDNVPSIEAFSTSFKDCVMNKKPLIELAVCCTTMSAPSVPMHYFTTNYGDGICDPYRKIPHAFCLETDSEEYFHSSSRHHSSMNVVSNNSQSNPYRKREKDFTSRNQWKEHMKESLLSSQVSEEAVHLEAIELWSNERGERGNFDRENPTIKQHFLDRARKILWTEQAGSWASASFALADSWYLDGIDRRHNNPQRTLKRLFPQSLNSYQEQRIDMNATSEKWDVQKHDWRNIESVYRAGEYHGMLHDDIVFRHTNQLQCRSGSSRNVKERKQYNYLQFNNRRNKHPNDKMVKISRRYGVGKKGETTIVLSNPSQNLKVGFEIQVSEALKDIVPSRTSVVGISEDRKILTIDKPLMGDIEETLVSTTMPPRKETTEDVTGFHIERIKCPSILEKRSGGWHGAIPPLRNKRSSSSIRENKENNKKRKMAGGPTGLMASV